MTESRLDVNRLLDAAIEEFALHGFEGMSMRTLAEKCSVTAAAIYYHFPSKEALYDEVCKQIFDDVVTRIDKELQGIISPELRMERFVSALFDIWENNHFLVLTQRDVTNATVYPDRSFSTPHYGLLFGLIRKIQSQYFDDRLDDALSYAFGSMLYGYCSLLVYSQRNSGQTWDEHRKQRKLELLAICRTFMGVREQFTTCLAGDMGST